MGKALLIVAVAVGVLAATFVATSLTRTFGQLHALVVATRALSQSPSPKWSLPMNTAADIAAPAPAPVAPGIAAVDVGSVTGAAAPLVLGYRPPERHAGFNADAMRAAIEAEPAIGELVNDPDPKVREAILAFFEN